MTTERSMPLDHVSAHAVLRYCERVLGVVGLKQPPDLPVFEFARWHCETAGVTYDTVRRAILTPAVEAAIKLGATSCRTEMFEACIQRGMVTTVHSDKEGGPRQLRLVVRTKREGQRFQQKRNRRARKRPAK